MENPSHYQDLNTIFLKSFLSNADIPINGSESNLGFSMLPKDTVAASNWATNPNKSINEYKYVKLVCLCKISM